MTRITRVMKLIKLFTAIFCSLALCTIGPATTGCVKEYSYEKLPLDSGAAKDSTPVSLPLLSTCARCANATTIPDSSWSFRMNGALLCGLAERAIITLDRTSFTFFGPSTCSMDSGFVASVYLSEPLNRNKTNVSAARVSFYYYDGLTPSYVLMSRNSDAFSLSIENYMHQTGEAIGSFSGAAYTENGSRMIIKEGKFKIRFP